MSDASWTLVGSEAPRGKLRGAFKEGCAGASIVPTLARLVLAFLFITAGYNKLFVDVSYTLEDAQKLKELGVRVEPDPGPTAARAFEIVPASYRRLMIQDDPEKTADDPPQAEILTCPPSRTVRSSVHAVLFHPILGSSSHKRLASCLTS